MSNKLSFKLSDLKALLAVFENIAGRSLSMGEFIGLLDLMNSFKADEPEEEGSRQYEDDSTAYCKCRSTSQAPF